jgi:hypothetical protein
MLLAVVAMLALVAGAVQWINTVGLTLVGW